MNLQNLIVPELEGVPVDDKAEPMDAEVEHIQDERGGVHI